MTSCHQSSSENNDLLSRSDPYFTCKWAFKKLFHYIYNVTIDLNCSKKSKFSSILVYYQFVSSFLDNRSVPTVVVEVTNTNILLIFMMRRSSWGIRCSKSRYRKNHWETERLLEAPEETTRSQRKLLYHSYTYVANVIMITLVNQGLFSHFDVILQS